MPKENLIPVMFVVFDLDGTLAGAEHRIHFITDDPKNKDWDSFLRACVDDEPILHALEVLRALHSYGMKVEIWTGRSDKFRAETEEWLLFHGVPDEVVKTLIMRPSGSRILDSKLKLSWVEERGTPDLVIEDRKQVVEAWRKLGVPCWQVVEGDY